MSKYHITKSGKPALCKAIKHACPLGKHFDTEEEAYENIQSQMSEEFGVLALININNQEKQINMSELQTQYDNHYAMIKQRNFKSQNEEEMARTKLAELSAQIKGNNVSPVNVPDILIDIHSPDSGATIAIDEDNFQATMPTTGFCASPYPEYSKVFDNAEEISFHSMLDFVKSLKTEDNNVFSQEDTYIGLWNDPETGKIYLDISRRYHTAKEARIACEENDQIAYFDLQLFESVDVDRNATSGQI